MLALADAALAFAHRRLGATDGAALYLARVDFLPGAGGEWLLSELELGWPEIFLRANPEAASLVATALLQHRPAGLEARSMTGSKQGACGSHICQAAGKAAVTGEDGVGGRGGFAEAVATVIPDINYTQQEAGLNGVEGRGLIEGRGADGDAKVGCVQDTYLDERSKRPRHLKEPGRTT